METLVHRHNDLIPATAVPGLEPTSFVLNNRRDPTRTTALRAAFASQMTKRFRHLRGLIWQAIVEEDVFGLLNNSPQDITILQTPGRRAFDFPRSADKVSHFMAWLQRQVDDGILQVSQFTQVGQSVEAAWTNIYISDSYRRGVVRARSELISGGFGGVTSIEATGGIGVSMANPFHIDRVGLLYTRTFNELKGITDAMSQHISRVLSQGIADGLHPRTLARQLNGVIRGTGGDLALRDSLGRFMSAERRAIILARTEIIRAHSEAQLQEFANWGVENVHVKAEWITAGDNRVCNQCANLEGSIFTIEKARGMIPLHAQCRCAWIPTRPIKKAEA